MFNYFVRFHFESLSEDYTNCFLLLSLCLPRRETRAFLYVYTSTYCWHWLIRIRRKIIFNVRMSEHAQTSEASLSAPQARRSVSFGPASVDNPSTRSSQPETLSPVSASDSLPKKARISDSMAQVVPSSSPMTPSSSSTGTLPNGSALKPALKAGSQSKRLPPPNQYQHPDPLLRRLRLVDDRGSPIDLKSFFRGVRVVAFYFGSQWAGQPLKEYHKVCT